MFLTVLLQGSEDNLGASGWAEFCIVDLLYIYLRCLAKAQRYNKNAFRQDFFSGKPKKY